MSKRVTIADMRRRAQTNTSWFDELSPAAKRAYVKKHPNSKYAKAVKALTSKGMGPASSNAAHPMHDDYRKQVRKANKAKGPKLTAKQKASMAAHSAKLRARSKGPLTKGQKKANRAAIRGGGA